MAFVAEDGTGLTLANSYITEAIADTHHTDRGNGKWTDLTMAQKEEALVRATDYIDKRFGRKFVGRRQSRGQGLEWPRSDAFDKDEFLLTGIAVDAVPRQLQKACAEYALRAALVNVLAPDVPAPVPSQDNQTGGTTGTLQVTGEITKERVKADVVETETEYRTFSDSSSSGHTTIKSSLVNDNAIPEYPEADMWIQELLKPATIVKLRRS